MSNRHRRAFDRIARAIDGAAVGRCHLARSAREIAAVELSALLDADAAIRAEVEELRTEVARRRERESALQDALVATQKERDRARDDIQRLGRGFIGLSPDEDGEIQSPRVWN